ncbi:hypothetical protein D3C84_657690 [compost metagenome]
MESSGAVSKCATDKADVLARVHHVRQGGIAEHYQFVVKLQVNVFKRTDVVTVPVELNPNPIVFDVVRAGRISRCRAKSPEVCTRPDFQASATCASQHVTEGYAASSAINEVAAHPLLLADYLGVRGIVASRCSEVERRVARNFCQEHDHAKRAQFSESRERNLGLDFVSTAGNVDDVLNARPVSIKPSPNQVAGSLNRGRPVPGLRVVNVWLVRNEVGELLFPDIDGLQRKDVIN